MHILCCEVLNYLVCTLMSGPFVCNRVILDMLVWLAKQTAIDLLLQPFSKVDAWYIRQGLLPPMHKGRYCCGATAAACPRRHLPHSPLCCRTNHIAITAAQCTS